MVLSAMVEILIGAYGLFESAVYNILGIKIPC
jgi:hypothetical protein